MGMSLWVTMWVDCPVTFLQNAGVKEDGFLYVETDAGVIVC